MATVVRRGREENPFLIKIRFGLAVMKTLFEKPFLFRICVFLVLDVGVWCLVLGFSRPCMYLSVMFLTFVCVLFVKGLCWSNVCALYIFLKGYGI